MRGEEVMRVMDAFSPSLTLLPRLPPPPCQRSQELRGGCELRLKQQTVRATLTPRKDPGGSS